MVTQAVVGHSRCVVVVVQVGADTSGGGEALAAGGEGPGELPALKRQQRRGGRPHGAALHGAQACLLLRGGAGVRGRPLPSRGRRCRWLGGGGGTRPAGSPADLFRRPTEKKANNILGSTLLMCGRCNCVLSFRTAINYFPRGGKET